jgi:hypothetical protein
MAQFIIDLVKRTFTVEGTLDSLRESSTQTSHIVNLNETASSGDIQCRLAGNLIFKGSSGTKLDTLIKKAAKK